MNLRLIFEGLAWPARSAACLLAVLAFTLVFALSARLLPAAGGIGSVFALLLLAITVPALARFLVAAAESRAGGRDVEPPGVELFTPAGGGAFVFPLLCTVATAALALPLAVDGAPAFSIALAVTGAFALPAVIGVYVITRSPLQSLNPVALAGLVRGLGIAYLALPIVLLLSGGLVRALVPVAGWLGLFAAVYLLLALHTLLGALLGAAGLPEAIELPRDEAMGDAIAKGAVERERRRCLEHAYGLFSRDNSRGALDYLGRWLDRDPDPAAARAWFQEQMLGWENKLPALRFGQDHVGWLLAGGEPVRAVKLILRLRLADERFRPAAGDLAAAAEALRQSGHAELADALGRSVS